MTKRTTHWTERSNDDFRYSVAFDFMGHVEDRLKSLNWSQDRLANEIGVSKGRISQLINNPGNLTLKSMVSIVRSLDMKLSIVSYNNEDSENAAGHIPSDVFVSCWTQFNKPCNIWEIEEIVGSSKVSIVYENIDKHTWHDKIRFNEGQCKIIEFPGKTKKILTDAPQWGKADDGSDKITYAMNS